MGHGLKIVGILLLIIATAVIGPALFLWSVNSLAEIGGSSFYIAHSLWSYFVALIFLVIMKARN